jgi:hypothetical protein
MIINGDLKLNETNITSIGKLKEVNGYLDLSFCENLKDLGNLQIVKGLFLNLNYRYGLKSLGKLKIVKGWLGLKYTDLKDLGQLEEVGGYIYIDVGSDISKEYIKKHKPQFLKQCFWINII